MAFSADAPRLWILGAGGLLGRALTRCVEPTSLTPNDPVAWQANDAPQELRRRAIAYAASSEPWALVWCAGAGIIGTEPAELNRETALLAAVLDGLATAPTQGIVLLASSGGGVYGGTRDVPISERTHPAPLSEYGHNKLRQEQLVADWAVLTGCRAAIARIANLYGPGQHLSKPQGLITQICRSTLTRQPVSIYVSLDTLRDYIYVDDCAQIMRDMLLLTGGLPAGTAITKIVASGRSVSIGSVLSEVRRVLGRAPTAVMARSATASQQGTALAFRSAVWQGVDRRSLTPLPVGIMRTIDDLRSKLRHGTLVPA